MSEIGDGSEASVHKAPIRLRLVVAYDGTEFHGLAPQPGQRTVGGVLLRALATVLREDVTASFVMSGRTDAGVHGWGQVVHVDVHTMPANGLERAQKAINKLVAPSIVVRSLEVAPLGFDARFSARWRRYRYSVLTTPTADPFLARTVWHVGQPLDLTLMRLACDPLLGEHDFSSFCRVPKGQPDAPMTRLLTAADWVDLDDLHPGLLRFEIQASSFCHQMVRAIVGLLVDVGRGRRRAGDVLTILHARSRAASSPIAPPEGLCLWAVGYDDGVSSMATWRHG